MHPFSQDILKTIAPKNYTFMNLIINISLFFVIGICVPMIITYLLNKTKYGVYLVGKLGIRSKANKKISSDTKMVS